MLIGLAVLPQPYTRNPSLLPYIILSANQIKPCLLSGSAIGRLVLCWQETTPSWIQHPRGQWEKRNEEGDICEQHWQWQHLCFVCFVWNLWSYLDLSEISTSLYQSVCSTINTAIFLNVLVSLCYFAFDGGLEAVGCFSEHTVCTDHNPHVLKCLFTVAVPHCVCTLWSSFPSVVCFLPQQSLNKHGKSAIPQSPKAYVLWNVQMRWEEYLEVLSCLALVTTEQEQV